MTTSPQQEPPSYDVIAVHEGQGDHPPFAHTVGLPARHDSAEIFVWSVPDTGVDPGESWSLSTRDLHSQLAEAVDRLHTGLLRLGDSWSSPLDSGRSALLASVVEAAGRPACVAPPDTPVWRLHLALLRPPAGRFVPLDPAAAQSLLNRVGRWHDAFAHELTLPPSRSETRFGPGSAGVQLVLNYFADLGPEGLRRLAALDAAGRDGSAEALVEAEAIARTSGRLHWTRAASAAVGRAVAGKPGIVSRRGDLRLPVGEALEAAAVAWVLSDLLDTELFRRATASLRAMLPLDRLLEHEPSADLGPVEAVHRVVRAAQAGPWPPHANAVLADLLPERAGWLLAWSGRGRVLVDSFPGGLPGGPVGDALRAAVVVDLDPDLGRLLRPTPGRG